MVDERRFGGARSVGGIEHRDSIACAEDTLESRTDVLSQLGELWAAMVDYRSIHRTQDTFGDVGGARNLQEGAAAHSPNIITNACESRRQPHAPTLPAAAL